MNDLTPIDRDNSRLLKLDRKGVRVSFSLAVSDLMGQLEATEATRKRKRRGEDRASLEATLGAMVADLYKAYLDDPVMALGYSRNGNDYNAPPRYRKSVGSLTTVTTAADFFTAAGYAEAKEGYYRRSVDAKDAWGDRGQRSRLRATPKLVSFLEDTYGIEPSHIGRQEEGEILRLKGTDKALMDYKDTSETKAMRRQLQAINQLIGNATIGLSSKPEGLRADLSAKRLYRVFNDGRFDLGGRFYGGWWINEKRANRHLITINRQQTVELDYSAFHLRMCNHLSGLAVPDKGDLYAIPGLEEMRKAVKYTFMILLNLEDGRRMPSKDEIKATLTGSWDISKLRKAVEKHYSEIGDWLGSGKGKQLQFIDSKIACEVLDTLAAAKIVALPVHDSFIVAKQHQNTLREAMMNAYTKVMAHELRGLKVYPVIDI